MPDTPRDVTHTYRNNARYVTVHVTVLAPTVHVYLDNPESEEDDMEVNDQSDQSDHFMHNFIRILHHPHSYRKPTVIFLDEPETVKPSSTPQPDQPQPQPQVKPWAPF